MWIVALLLSLAFALSAVQGKSATVYAIYMYISIRSHTIILGFPTNPAESVLAEEQRAQTGIRCYVDVAGEKHVLERHEHLRHSSDPCRLYTCKVRNIVSLSRIRVK